MSLFTRKRKPDPDELPVVKRPAGATSKLLVRRRGDGSVEIQGGAPVEHVFPAKWLAREIASGLVSVEMTLRAANGVAYYEILGFEPLLEANGEQARDSNGDLRFNFTGWHAKRI